MKIRYILYKVLCLSLITHVDASVQSTLLQERLQKYIYETADIDIPRSCFYSIDAFKDSYLYSYETTLSNSYLFVTYSTGDTQTIDNNVAEDIIVDGGDVTFQTNNIDVAGSLTVSSGSATIDGIALNINGDGGSTDGDVTLSGGTITVSGAMGRLNVTDTLTISGSSTLTLPAPDASTVHLEVGTAFTHTGGTLNLEVDSSLNTAMITIPTSGNTFTGM